MLLIRSEFCQSGPVRSDPIRSDPDFADGPFYLKRVAPNNVTKLLNKLVALRIQFNSSSLKQIAWIKVAFRQNYHVCDVTIILLVHEGIPHYHFRVLNS